MRLDMTEDLQARMANPNLKAQCWCGADATVYQDATDATPAGTRCDGHAACSAGAITALADAAPASCDTYETDSVAPGFYVADRFATTFLRAIGAARLDGTRQDAEGFTNAYAAEADRRQRNIADDLDVIRVVAPNPLTREYGARRVS